MAKIVPARGKQTASIIFLHGLGDSGHGWADTFSRYKPKYAKLVCPHASERPVTINDGYVMPAWWDIRSLDKLDGNEDEEGIKKCAVEIQDLIQAEIDAGIPASRIILGGFSQGAATALYTGLTGKFKLAGLVILSGYLPIQSTITWSQVNKVPILQCHGKADTVVHYHIGEMANTVVKKHLPEHVTFISYEGLPHTSCPEELEDVNEFFEKHLPEQN